MSGLGKIGSGLLVAVLFLGTEGKTAENLDSLRSAHRTLLAAVRRKAPKTPYLVIDTHDNQLLLRRETEILRRAACATGSGRKLEGRKRWHKWVFDTPKGRFRLLRKVRNPMWVRPVWDFVEAEEEIPVFAEDHRRFQRGILGEYALYFAKEYMIHGTLYEINLGKSVTHGCVRVGKEDLKYLYDTVEVGWDVYVY